MHFLVTGGAGYIGSHFVRMCLRLGHTLDVVDNLCTGFEESLPSHEGLQFIRCDIADALWTKKIRKPVDGAIHFAASIEVGESMANPQKYIKNNLDNGKKWLELAWNVGVKKVIHSSTAAVYGLPTQGEVSEKDPTKPINPYGETKKLFEEHLEQFAYRNGEFKFASLRYFNAAGAEMDGSFGEAHEPESHLIPRAIKAALNDQTFTVNGRDYGTPDGTCIRDYIHLDDLAQAHLSALVHLESNPSNKFNLGSGKGSSNLEVLRCVEKYVEKPLKIAFGPRRQGDPDKLIANIDKAKKLLKFSPKNSLEDIVKSAVLWHRGHPKGYRN